jgi:uncharacterized protein with FMN-binding domain
MKAGKALIGSLIVLAVISGASVSSRVIQKSIENALRK